MFSVWLALLACNIINYSSRSSPFLPSFALSSYGDVKAHADTHVHPRRLAATQSNNRMEGLCAKILVFSFLAFRGRKKKGLNVYLLLLAQVRAELGHLSLHVCCGQMWYQGTMTFCGAPFFTHRAETWHSEELDLWIWLWELCSFSFTYWLGSNRKSAI